MKYLGMVFVALLSWNTAYAQQTLSASEQEALVYLAEEERLAMDLYQHFAEQWDAQVFHQIAASEQRHLDMVSELARQYGIDLPDVVTGGVPGTYHHAELNTLYAKLKQGGSASLSAALTVAALVEETDIKDLSEALSATSNAELQERYEKLITASGKHLRAFTRNLERQGEAYTPTVLSPEDYEAALQGSMRGCGGEGKGQGKGNCRKGGEGKGNCQKSGKGKGCCAGKSGAGSGCSGKGQQGEGRGCGKGAK